MTFIETIKIENGEAKNLNLHIERASETCFRHFGLKTILPFERIVNEKISDHSNGIFKLRIIYSNKIEHFTIDPYQPKIVKSLKIVEGGNIDYSLKYEDRSELEKLLEQKGECDDILIVKDGFITDTSFSNIAFITGNKIFTPSTYLLNGVKRQLMLSEGDLLERPVKPSDINSFSGIFLINSMLDLYPVEKVIF